MNVPQNAAFRTGKLGPETMSGGTGTLRSVILSRTSGSTLSAGAGRATMTVTSTVTSTV
jgi:hypothetical protein